LVFHKFRFSYVFIHNGSFFELNYFSLVDSMGSTVWLSLVPKIPLIPPVNVLIFFFSKANTL